MHRSKQSSSAVSHLLFEIASLLLINQHQVEVITHRELLVDVPHGWSQLIASQKEPDGNGLPWKEHRAVSTDRMQTETRRVAAKHKLTRPQPLSPFPQMD